MNDQLNNIFNQVNKSLLCGPGTECEKNKRNQNLEQTYLDAKTNLSTAPEKMKEAEKNYYLQKFGVNGYNSILEQQLTDKSNQESQKIKDNFDKNINEIMKKNDILENLIVNNNYIEELYNKYIDKNLYLTNKINHKGTDIVTNDRKTYYETENYERLLGWYNVWYRIYFLIFFLLVLGLFTRKKDMNPKGIIGIIFIFLLYPFIINKIVFFIIKTFFKLYSLLPKNVYN